MEVARGLWFGLGLGIGLGVDMKIRARWIQDNVNAMVVAGGWGEGWE